MEKIKTLDAREQARDKISIWFGSASNYTHPVKEVVANATDEIINNFEGGNIYIKLHDDKQTITIGDTGRGVAIGEYTDGVPNYELLFETLFAGTKYGDTERTTTGTNGCGTAVINYTSEYFNVKSYSNGICSEITYRNGALEKEYKEYRSGDWKHGSIFTFRLDPSIYTNTTFNEEEISAIVKRFAVGSNKVTLIFSSGDREDTFHFNNVNDYYQQLVGNGFTSPTICPVGNTIKLENEETIEFNLVFSTTIIPRQETYLNLTYLEHGGSINDGFIAGTRSFFNKYAKDNKLFPKGFTIFTPSDIQESFSFVVSALSNRVEFTNQTKLATSKESYKKAISVYIKQILETTLIEEPRVIEKMSKHILQIQKHNSVALKQQKELKKKLSGKVEGISNRVGKLVDSKKHGDAAELYIAEGNSALGSIVLARDANFQAAYPLRGKILNCLKADYPTIFKNEVVTDLIKVLGCGIQADKKNKDLDTFDIKNLRYGKIIGAADQDADGAQIICLLITLFYRLMPDILKEGKFYIAQTPLYEVKTSDDEIFYIFSESEKEKTLKRVHGKYTIARAKGLGELSQETMSETALNKETRHLTQVIIKNEADMKRVLEKWMGSEVEGRKEIITERLKEFVEVID